MELEMDKICRVCLKGDTELYLIFDDKYSLDNNSLAQILSECTIYKVNRYDELPHQICGDCMDLAKKAFIFKRECEKAYRQLISMLSDSFSSQNGNVVSSSRIKLESDGMRQAKSTQTDDSTMYPCERCEQKFFSFDALRVHRENEHKGSAIVCRFCAKSFSRVGYLKTHIAVFHPEFGYTSHNQCSICKRQFTRREHMRRHLAVIHKIVEIVDVSDMNNQGEKVTKCGAGMELEDEHPQVNDEGGKLGKQFVKETDCFAISITADAVAHSNRTSLIESVDERDDDQPDVKPLLSDEEDEKPLSELARVPSKSFVEILIDQGTNDEAIKSVAVDPTNTIKMETATSPTLPFNDEVLTVEPCQQFSPALTTDTLSEDKEYKCPACGKAFHRRSTLQKHLANHIKKKPLSCKICMKRFSRADFLKRHLHNKHDEAVNGPLKCDECNLNFVHPTHFKRHKETKHSSIKMHACEICQKSFTTKLYMQRHLESHTKKRFMCKECAESFFTRDELNEHIKSEGHDKPLLCPICGLRCKTNNILTVHMRRHKGEKPFKCKFCSKGFPRMDDLRIHEKYHTGEKSHFCETCGKGFQRKYNLTIHMRVHTGEKPYQCPHCPQAFSQSNDLKSHIRRHTGERFRCEYCGAPFLQGYQMRQHKLAEHGVKENPPTQRLEKYTSPEEQEQQIKQNLQRELAKGMDLMDGSNRTVGALEVQSLLHTTTSNGDVIIPMTNTEEVAFLNI